MVVVSDVHGKSTWTLAQLQTLPCWLVQHTKHTLTAANRRSVSISDKLKPDSRAHSFFVPPPFAVCFLWSNTHTHTHTYSHTDRQPQTQTHANTHTHTHTYITHQLADTFSGVLIVQLSPAKLSALMYRIKISPPLRSSSSTAWA